MPRSRHAAPPALAVVRGTTTPAAPLGAHAFIYEDADPPRGWRVLYALDPVTRDRIAEARCEVGDDVSDLADCLTRRVERRLASARTTLTLG